VRGRNTLNTVYTVAKQAQREDQQLVFDDPASDWNVFRNPGAGPRAWVRHSLDHIESGPSAPQACEGEESARFERPHVNEALVRVRAACPGMLIVAEPWDEDWGAEVGGRPVRVYRYWKALRAVEVPAGESEVRFVYRPAAAYRGATLTALGLMLCAGAGIVLWRRPSNAAAASR
jgi:hypothetical protein